MTTKFEAKNITILRFTRKPDRSGEIIPPECHVTFPSKVWVHFDRGDGVDEIVGKAKIKREGNLLLADFSLVSSYGADKAFVAISKLKPCICGRYLDAAGMTVLRLNIDSISLALQNADKMILPLGDRLRIISGKGLQ